MKIKNIRKIKYYIGLMEITTTISLNGLSAVAQDNNDMIEIQNKDEDNSWYNSTWFNYKAKVKTSDLFIVFIDGEPHITIRDEKSERGQKLYGDYEDAIYYMYYDFYPSDFPFSKIPDIFSGDKLGITFVTSEYNTAKTKILNKYNDLSKTAEVIPLSTIVSDSKVTLRFIADYQKDPDKLLEFVNNNYYYDRDLMYIFKLEDKTSKEIEWCIGYNRDSNSFLNLVDHKV